MSGLISLHLDRHEYGPWKQCLISSHLHLYLFNQFDSLTNENTFTYNSINIIPTYIIKSDDWQQRSMRAVWNVLMCISSHKTANERNKWISATRMSFAVLCSLVVSSYLASAQLNLDFQQRIRIRKSFWPVCLTVFSPAKPVTEGDYFMRCKKFSKTIENHLK